MKKYTCFFWVLLIALGSSFGFAAGAEDRGAFLDDAFSPRNHFPISLEAPEEATQQALAKPNSWFMPEDSQEESHMLSMLSNETLLQVLGFLSEKDLNACSETCQRLHTLVRILPRTVYLSESNFTMAGLLHYKFSADSPKDKPLFPHKIKTIKGKAGKNFSWIYNPYCPDNPYALQEKTLDIYYPLWPCAIPELSSIKTLFLNLYDDQETVETLPTDPLTQVSLEILRPTKPYDELSLLSPKGMRLDQEMLTPPFRHLKNLKNLSFFTSLIMIPHLPNLIDALPHPDQLKKLSFVGYLWSEASIKSLASMLGQLASLESLRLERNGLSSTDAQLLALELPKLQNLKELNMAENPMDSVGTLEIAKSVSPLPHLSFLNLKETKTNEATEKEIQDLFQNRPTIEISLGKL